MKIVIMGHGKMGRMVEELARQKGWEILAALDAQDAPALAELPRADVAIDFSHPDMLEPLAEYIQRTGTALCSGTTGYTPAQQQHAYTLSHDLADVQQGQYPDGRYALSWEEIRRIAARHEICCHTDSHIALSPDVSAEALRREIVDAKRTLEQRAGRRVDVFAWKSGAEYNADLRAHRYFEEAGYRFLVSSVKIEKIG